MSKKMEQVKRVDMYSIGQVLYVVLSKKNQVYPMQVIETITKRTLQGEEISYVLQAGADKDSKVTLDKVEGEVFETSEKARKTLVQRATAQINRLVDTAVTKSSEWYNVVDQPQSIHDLPDLIPKTVHQVDEETSTVSMPDGSVVRVKLPSIMRDSV